MIDAGGQDCAHLANIPETRSLVLGVGQQVTAVSLGVQMSQPLAVPHQHARRLGPSPQRPPIPHLCIGGKLVFFMEQRFANSLMNTVPNWVGSNTCSLPKMKLYCRIDSDRQEAGRAERQSTMTVQIQFSISFRTARVRIMQYAKTATAHMANMHPTGMQCKKYQQSLTYFTPACDEQRKARVGSILSCTKQCR